jgi:hypothetical protein
MEKEEEKRKEEEKKKRNRELMTTYLGPVDMVQEE